MELQFLGANGNVTGSSTLVTLPNNKQIVIDCGIMQDNSLKYNTVYNFNSRDFEFDLKNIECVILTHAHLDHIGRLPLLTKQGYEGKILATEPTAKLALINLKDAAYLAEQEVFIQNKRRNKDLYNVLYTIDEAKAAAKQVRCYDYNKKIYIDNNTTVELIPNGHMIGSAMIKIEYLKDFKKQTILFTGDTSGFTTRHPFIVPAQKINDVDTIITESTYGDRFHKKINIKSELQKIIKTTCIENKKTLLMPVFSIQRSTEIIQILYELYKENKIFKNIPIYLDSPMAISSTEIINSSKQFWSNEWNEKFNNNQTFFNHNFVKYTNSAKESRGLANGTPKIILSSSGMAQGGRILHHLISFLPSKKCSIVFTGYCGEGTLAHELINTKQKSISIMGTQVRIKANVKQLPFSSHADQNELIDLISTSNDKTLKNIFIIHGDKDSSSTLQKKLTKQYNNVNIKIPVYKEIFKI